MSLYAWGRNTYGQLGVKQEPRPRDVQGDGQQQQVQQPAEPSAKFANSQDTLGQKPLYIGVDDDRLIAAAAGEYHTLVVTQYGDVKSFGRGREGQLGHGELSRQVANVPRKVEGLSDVTVVAIACGAFHSLAVTSSGQMYEWGLVHTDPIGSAQEEISDAELLSMAGPNEPHHITSHLSSVVADSARRWLTAADVENSDGEASSGEDELADAERTLMQQRMMARLPTRHRQAVPRCAVSLQKMRVISVGAGYAHSVAVTDQGRAFSNGQNDRGQLGLGHRIHSGIFREVVGMSDRFIIEVACGEQHNLARALPSRKLLSGGEQAELYVWGGGRLGQLGLGNASTRLAPTHNTFLRDVGGGVVSVSAGSNHSVCAVKSGLTLSWGHAEYNQQGIAVVAGADLTGDGDGYGCFRVPRVVNGLIGTHVVSVHCGSNFTLAVDRNGVTHSFGWNEGDVLGRGSLGNYDPSPDRVLSLPGVVSVAAGSRHAAVVTVEWPAVGRHLRPLVGDAESADVELLAPDAALRGQPGFPAHMAVISARCPYLAGYLEAALKAGEEESSDYHASSLSDEAPKIARLSLENATADTISILARYLYTDEVPSNVPGETLDALGELTRELLLPRLERLCVQKLPYSRRRRYIQRNPGIALAASGIIDVPRSTFYADLGKLAGRPNRSDVLLVLPAWDWEFHCHKAILCSSPWWCALLKGGFREGGRDTVDMSGLLHEGVTQPEALEAAVRHVYTNSTQTVVGLDPSIVMEVVIIAEFMVLPSLTRACQCELGQYVDEDSASNLVDFAQRYRLLKLKSLCLERLRENHAVPAAPPRRDFRMKVDVQKDPPDYRRRFAH